MMIVRGVNLFPTQIEELLLRIGALAPHYQIMLTRTGRLDDMEICIEARAEVASAAARAAAGEQREQAVKDRIGVNARVSVAAPGSLERSVGKARRVVDKRVRE